MANVGMNGNQDNSPADGILNSVWDQTQSFLRIGPGGAGILVSKQMTFAGGTLNDPGDFDGSGTPWTLWTVTGQVLVAVIAVCSTALTGAAGTFSVGKSGAVTRYLPTTTATTIGVGDTVDSTGKVAAGTTPLTTPNQIAVNGEVIIGTTATADITAGVLTFYAFYRPLTLGAKLS